MFAITARDSKQGPISGVSIAGAWRGACGNLKSRLSATWIHGNLS